MNTAHSKPSIRERFASHEWAVNLCINGKPMNHNQLMGNIPTESWTYYSPLTGETRDHAIEQFFQDVERAATKSKHGPSVLVIEAVEWCDNDVIEWLTTLIYAGRETRRRDGSRLDFDPENFIVNLWVNEYKPAGDEGAERTLGASDEPNAADTLSECTLHERFASRNWAVNLSINDVPVNHCRPLTDLAMDAWARYYPLRWEDSERALDRFIRAVEMAATKSLRGPAVLDIRFVEECNTAVTEWLAILLQTGRALTWSDGPRFELNPANLIVNLQTDEFAPATPGVVKRLVG